MSSPNEVVQHLLRTPEVQRISDLFVQGELEQANLFSTLQHAVQSDSMLLELPIKQHKSVFGQLTGIIRKRRPTVKQISLGDSMMSMSDTDRRAWREGAIERIVLPVASLLKQVHSTAMTEPDDPRRTDLIWHILNTAITAIRTVAIVGISDYVDQGIGDPHLNRALFEILRKPSDGAWSQLVFAPSAGKEHSLLSVLNKRDVQNSGLRTIQANLKSVRFSQSLGDALGLPNKSPKQLNELVDVFVQFRNQMVHGIFLRTRPPVESVDVMLKLLDLLIAALDPVLSQVVFVPTDDGLVEAMGPTMGLMSERTLSKEIQTQYRNQPLIIEDNRILSLSPWVTVADLQSLLEDLSDGEMNNGIHLHEVCFCNRFESDLLYYLGFTAKGQVPHSELQDGQTAMETYTQFTQMMEAFRLRSAPSQARTQDPIIRFDELAQFHGENFVGRTDILASIEDFIAHPPTPIGVITAAPGMGKSAVLTHFYRQFGAENSTDGWIFHFAARHNQRDNVFLGLRSLIAQGERQLDALSTKSTKRKSLPWSYEDLCVRLEQTLNVLGQAMQSQNKRAVLVLDALDEQTPRPGTPPESIFGSLPEIIPNNVVVLVSVRIDQSGHPVGISQGDLRPPKASGIPLAHPLTGLTETDVAELVYERLHISPSDITPQVMDKIVQGARRPEDGTLDPFYLRFLADKIREESLNLTEPQNIPNGLAAFFQDIWMSLDTGQDFLLHKILGMLSEMEGYGSDDLFGEVLAIPSEMVSKMRFEINKILLLTVEDGEAQYGLFHDRFRWFIQSKFTERDKVHHFHDPLLQFCRRTLSICGHYGLRYWTLHLQILSKHSGCSKEQQQEYQDQMWALLHNADFIQEKYDAFQDENSIIGDFIRAIDVFKPVETDDHATQLNKVKQVTTLATTSTQTITNLANLARKRLMKYAESGDIERVIQFAKRAGGRNLEWMTILRCAKRMQEYNLDPTPLYDSIEANDSTEIQWTDREMLNLLLKQVNPPTEIVTLIRQAVPRF